MTLKINPTIDNLKESATLAINQQALQLRREGKDLVHFGFGQSPFPVHPKIVHQLANDSHRKEYLPTFGLPQLRDNIASYYGKRGYNWQADNIAIGPGSKELLFDLMYILSGSLLLPVPSWVSYYPQAQLVGKNVIPVMTSYDNDYKITPESLLDACAGVKSGEQLTLLLNSPNNPAGNVYSEEELSKLADVIRDKSIIVISDEIYGEVCFEDTIAPSIASYIPANTLVTSGLSKSFSAGGYRLGFLAMPQQLALQIREGLKTLISETYSCVATPIQYAAVIAYSDDQEINQYVQSCNQIHKLMAKYIQQRLADYSINCPMSGGAFYLFPDFNYYQDALQQRGIINNLEMCNVLLAEAGVALLPAVDFGLPPNYYGCRLATVDYDGTTLIKAKQHGATDEELLALAPNIAKGCDYLGEWVAKLQQ